MFLSRPGRWYVCTWAAKGKDYAHPELGWIATKNFWPCDSNDLSEEAPFYSWSVLATDQDQPAAVEDVAYGLEPPEYLASAIKDRLGMENDLLETSP